MRYLVRVFAIALAVTLTATHVAAATDFTVTGVCCTAYNINGQSSPTLTVVRGRTYSFTCDNCDVHPFRIQSAQGFNNTLYLNLVSGPNPGTSNWILTVPIEDRATTTLYYQCGVHSAMNGTINVVDPPPAGTPTPSPTPTPTPSPCVGDCNGDNVVTVDDLLVMVNIALGSASVSLCPKGDVNNDKSITVDELVAAVDDALGGCTNSQSAQSPPPTATAPPPPPAPTATPPPTVFVPPYYVPY